MRLIARIFLPALLFCGLFTSCSKEYSLEEGAPIVVGGGTAEGTIGGNTALCTNTQQSGLLGAGMPLTDSNRIVVEMNFTKIGTYSISSDTINGIYFSKTGTATTTGATQVTLNGSGTPLAAGNYNFTVKFKTSSCSFPLTVYEVATAVGTDYFPTTASSNWGYISTDPAATAEDTIRNIATATTFSVTGNTYTLFTTNSFFGTDSSLYRKGGGEYHEFGDLDVAGIADNFVAADYIFLKDNVPAGTEWESAEGDADINSVTVKLKLRFSLVAKDTTLLVNNRIYKNVIIVRTTELVQQAGTFVPVLAFETWYAKGIGVINVVAPAPIYGFRITTYTVL